jgi:hypothetical protein
MLIGAVRIIALVLTKVSKPRQTARLSHAR